MNADFKWHFISIFDLFLHGNQQPLIPLRPSLQTSKAVYKLWKCQLMSVYT